MEEPAHRISDRALEAGVRIGCGAVLGILLGVFWAIYSLIGRSSGWLVVAELVGCVTVCAFLSWRFADVFYEVLAKWLPWLV